MNTLVVGQDIYMLNGIYIIKGKVVKVTPNGVDVQTGAMQNNGTWNAHELLHFDKNGDQRDYENWGIPELAPYHLDDMPFAERTALLERRNQKALKHE